MKIFKKKLVEMTVKDVAKVYLVWQTYKIGEMILDSAFGPSINRRNRKLRYKNNVAKIKRLAERGWTNSEIAEEMNVSRELIRTVISEIKKG